MAAFPGPAGKTILVRNHEVTVGEESIGAFGDHNELAKDFPWDRFYDPGKGRHAALGGTTTLVYDTRTQRLEKHSLSLTGTVRNCAGGPTPWQSWITCEESVMRAGDPLSRDHGYNFEVPATAKMQVFDPIPLKAMGRFNHEAVAVHARSGIVYQTEDRADGLFYRFLPNERGRLVRGGRLQALALRDKRSADARNWTAAEISPGQSLAVTWIDIDNVESPQDDLRQQGFDRGAAVFARGEGIWANADEMYYATTDGGPKHGGQNWRYTASLYERTEQESRDPPTHDLYLETNDTNQLENANN
jgi:secreted PhoX family phosphatase